MCSEQNDIWFYQILKETVMSINLQWKHLSKEEKETDSKPARKNKQKTAKIIIFFFLQN